MSEIEKGTDIPQVVPVPEKSDIAKREEDILAFWDAERIFEKSVEKDAPRGEFTFYDGPPFATGLPHHGHVLPGTIKDAIPRYRTMRGYRVRRMWGWDCHGLPLENIIEQEQGIRNKREIEERGINNFVEAARAAVLRYADDWRRIIPRMGRWVDMENDYKTMDTTYTESVWWSFKTLFEKGLVYEGYKSMHLCPRCGTTLANFEVAQGYKDIEDISVYVKLPLEGEANTSLLVWTTTPWTLPGNTAAAVHNDIVYVKVEHQGEYLILAKEKLDVIPGEANIIAEFSGKELVGKKYEPPFSYFKGKSDLKGKSKGWRIYHAPYVTTDNGTGAVHLAPAFGDVDLDLAQKEGFPVVHHVTQDGLFTPDVTDFAGLLVKKKGAHQDTDKRIVEALTHSGKLFKQETIVHSYPHCWRCDTPLLVYAASSWFVKVSKIKAQLIAANKTIGWVPKHVGEGRFHNLLETAPDWAISRARYWGAPLPMWRNEKTGELQTLGSIDELLTHVKRSGNRYFVMRHGQARSNVEGFLDSGAVTTNGLTDKGREQAASSAEDLIGKGIDLVVVSPVLRAQETADIVCRRLGLSPNVRMTDERLREDGFGTFEGKSITEWTNRFPDGKLDFFDSSHGGESYADVRQRVGAFLFELERRYTGKTILLVTHDTPGWLLDGIARRKSVETLSPESGTLFLKNAEVREIPFVPYPHNAKYDLDLHRPYIDEITWGDAVSGIWRRVPDVFDCWYESGAMPFASNHYPFEGKERFNPKRMFGLGSRGYPADFIAESIDQTRGWFYSTLVLGVALFGKTAYRHVITNGLVLAADGKKMSKKLKNYTDVTLIADRYGADALRYYLLSSSLIRGEDLNFIDRSVDEIAKKLIMRLDNVRSFYALYDDKTVASPHSEALLDRWILSRLNELIAQSTAGYEAYELDVATRPIADFIDDLSTWYLRRSRDRFKGDSADDAKAARATLRFVLTELSKVMAPIMPFYSEYLYRAVSPEGAPISVHLTEWPEGGSSDGELLSNMKTVREVVSLGLEARASANIKVRQPLASLTVCGKETLDDGYVALVRDEINVKEIRFLSEGEGVELDVVITPALRKEGMRRDVARLIQAFRKEQNLTVSDRPKLTLRTNAEGRTFVESIKTELCSDTGLAQLVVAESAEGAANAKDLPFPIELSLEPNV